ncbi:ABC transporter substrate-binding protein [Pelosinus sp. sgz500959]|uniref:ABC transporter substrate-binding protein n=1 Tax=Pelosinus sp. sgz500959 TaxID=3242472 RepID=UPI00366B4BB5
MRRYQPLLLIAFFFLVTIITGITYLSGYAGKTNPDNVKHINVYTTLPIEQISLLAQEYEKKQSVRINLVPLSEQDLLARVKVRTAESYADVIIANQTVLEQAKKNKVLLSYTSEQTDIIPERFKDEENSWTGLWYDPIVFAVNQDFIGNIPKVPTTWNDLVQDNKFRICLTDFLAAEASANLFYTLIAINGETQTFTYLKKIHPQIIQYAKFLATPVRMVGMGEADIAIATQSETLRYINNKFPIKLIYPEDGTAFILTGVGLVSGTQHESDAKQFIDWLLQDTAQNALATNNFYLVPTNPETLIYKQYSTKKIKLLEDKENFTTEQKSQLLDKWVKTVRFASK